MRVSGAVGWLCTRAVRRCAYDRFVDHIAILDSVHSTSINGKSIHRRAAGRFYTHKAIAKRLVSAMVPLIRHGDGLSIVDPFGGDGRLVCWLLEALVTANVRRVKTSIWEHNSAAASIARERVLATASRLGIDVDVELWVGDTFARAAERGEQFDVVITNPPWELLKPDRRELGQLPKGVRDEYVAELRAFDTRLARAFPYSQPSRRFAGWGTNLSRVGTEVAHRLTSAGGVCGIVAPSSLLADSTTARLREWILHQFTLVEVTYWPAEARLFENVDVPCLSMISVRHVDSRPTRLVRMDSGGTIDDSGEVRLERAWLSRRNYAIPVIYGARGVALLRELDTFPAFSELEGNGRSALWAGRELDETRRAAFTLRHGKRSFVRSVHIARLRRPVLPVREFIDEAKRRVPASADRVRIVWRDIARPSQKRRMHATVLPAGPVTGNSVGVAHFRDDDRTRLLALLGLISSMPFEFQVRALSMTNHVSLSVMRACRLPRLDGLRAARVAEATQACLSGAPRAEAMLERAAAEAYGLDRTTWQHIVDMFKLGAQERDGYDDAWRL